MTINQTKAPFCDVATPRFAAPSAPTTTTRASWQRRKAARPSEILHAARKAFVEHGFTDARMSDIARLANVTKGTIYLYYRNKENLFETVVRDTFVTSLDPRLKTSNTTSSQEALEATIRLISEVFRDHDLTALLKTTIAEGVTIPALALTYRNVFIEPIAQALRNAVGKFEDTNAHINANAEYLAQLCVAPAFLSAIWPESLQEPNTTFGAGTPFSDFIRSILVQAFR